MFASRALKRAWRLIVYVDLLIRIDMLAFICVLVLLGAVSASPDLTWGQVGALLGVAIGFNVYGFVFNDVMGLALDRTEPRRARCPLVRGTLTRRRAMLLALAPIPAILILTASLGGGAQAYALILLSFGLVAVYNFWGKRFVLPPLTDLVLGLSSASLVMYGAVVVGAPSGLTLVVASYAALHTALITLHGALRDLANDTRCGAFTSAILFGAKEEQGNIVATRWLWIYGSTLNLTLIGLVVFWLAVETGSTTGLGDLRFAAVVVSAGLSLLLLTGVYTLRGPLWDLTTGLHMIVSYLPLMLLGFHYFPPELQLVGALSFIVPLVVVHVPIAFGGNIVLGGDPIVSDLRP